MKVRGKKGSLVIKKTSLDGKFISSKTIGYGRQKRARHVCAIDPASVATIIGATVSTAMLIAQEYRVKKKQSCKFYLSSRQRNCNRPIINTEIVKRGIKTFRIDICDHNHAIESRIYVKRAKSH